MTDKPDWVRRVYLRIWGIPSGQTWIHGPESYISPRYSIIDRVSWFRPLKQLFEVKSQPPGSGWVDQANPQTRFVCGLFLFLAIVWSHPGVPVNLFVVLIVLLGWVLALGIRPGALFRLCLYGLLMALPVVLIYVAAPYVSQTPYVGYSEVVHVNGILILVLKMVGAIMVVVSTVRSIPIDQLGKVFEHMPLPRIVRLILVQILHQTYTLRWETLRMVRAMQVRTVGTSRMTRFRLLASIPVVWMERLLYKSERVALAMEMRQYVERPMGVETFTRGTVDFILLISGASVFLEVLLIRLFVI